MLFCIRGGLSGCLKRGKLGAVQQRAAQFGIGADIGNGKARTRFVCRHGPPAACKRRNAVFLQQAEYVFTPVADGNKIAFAGGTQAA